METKLIISSSILAVMINDLCLFFLQDVLANGNVTMIISAFIAVAMSYVCMYKIV